MGLLTITEIPDILAAAPLISDVLLAAIVTEVILLVAPVSLVLLPTISVGISVESTIVFKPSPPVVRLNLLVEVPKLAPPVLISRVTSLSLFRTNLLLSSTAPERFVIDNAPPLLLILHLSFPKIPSYKKFIFYKNNICLDTALY